MNLARDAKAIGKLLLKNGTVVDPEKEKAGKGDVLIEDGKLVTTGKVGADGFDGTVIDVTGMVVCPGLIDMHVHLREPGREDEETVITGCDAAMAGGFTSISPMPNTDPAADNAEVIHFLKDRSRDLVVDVFPIAAVSRGRAGVKLTEMAELVEAGAVAFSDDGDPVATSELLRRAFEYTSLFDVPIIEHCEDKSLTVDTSMNEGWVSTRAGMRGMPAIAEDIIVARDIHVAEYTGGKLHIAHISTAGAVELVRQAKKRGVRVSCEVTPHHFTLTDEAVLNYDTNAKMNPPLRSRKDVEAMLAGLADGTIEVIATDHAPHSSEEKEVEFDAAPFGILGLETALGLVITELVDKDVLSLPQALARLTTGPANILSVDRGRFMKGSSASVTVFDSGEKWRVDKSRFKSKSRNTPFHDREMKGKVFGLFNRGLWWQADSAE